MRPLGVCGPPLPKERPRLLDKREKHAALEQQDRAERRKCVVRSQGICEVVEVDKPRCKKPGRQNHHLLGGNGRRNRGASILSEHRMQVCDGHHTEITGHVLIASSQTFLADLQFERIT